MLNTTIVTSRAGDPVAGWTQSLRVAICGAIALATVAGLAVPAYAQEAEAESLWTTDVAVDTLWVLIAGILVFFMNAGFGFIEAGFCRAKNAVNILAKNFVVFGISSIAFWLIGWSLMFGDGNSLLGLTSAAPGSRRRSRRWRRR